MDQQNEPAADAIAALVPVTLRALHALEFAGRHLSPATLAQLIKAVAGRESDVAAALSASRALTWPERLQPARDCLEQAAAAAGEGITGLLAANEAPQPMFAAYRALRAYARAAEAIYPMAIHLRPVSQFFLEAAARDDATVAARLAAVDPVREHVGVMHVGGKPGTRGAFSLYVPEWYDAARAWPLVVALHGGSGNGGAFLWSWVREARTRGFIVVAPTAAGSTWSLMEPEVDGPNIDRMIADVAGQWRIDAERQLLTGMSDGGTFTYVLGLRGDCHFTHLAPIAASFHPLLMTFADSDRVRGLPVHIVHGTHDWMFPPEMAQGAHLTLQEAGADVIYREIPDLSHTYPRDENAAILDWFLGSRPAPR
ncbi:phospholipase [Reyranella sp. CPCC 100927]|uniref:carboxylesterase family protein n=1 Tax=Reyranella sp. CPCC 100927 TaxID=2599616 RepID=UPI0011B7D4B1|nr:phospholipase [Reyranella sp. CPCC 100927]TWT15127.1 phospholipase [Reyranella sp. CPCC 100927]